MNTPLPAIDIDTLEAGPDLDALVDEVIFGYEYIRGYGAPEYSTSIAAAWEVVEKLQSMGYRWTVASRRTTASDLRFIPFAEFWHYTKGTVDSNGMADAPTAPLAICRAAYKAINAQNQM